MKTDQIPGPGWRLLVQGTVADLYVVPRDSGEPVVAKVLRELSDEYRRAFKREYRVLAARVHAGLIGVLGGDLDAPRPFYFMPFLSGGSITRLAGALDARALANLGRWIAEAMSALHANNMQHGDLKPDNLLMTERGAVHVSDPLGNGSGCTVSLGTKCGGTPGYWAPEIAIGGPISRAGDVFSLGATLFHLATGITPQDGMSMDPVAHNVSLPEQLRQAIVAMCRADPARRPSMQKVAAYLLQTVQAMDTSRTTEPANTPPARDPETPPWLKFVLGAAATAAAAAIANRATKTWNPQAERYRNSDGTFRGGGLFD